MEWFRPTGPRDIVGAWILAAALIFGLFAASQFESDGPDLAQWAASYPSRQQGDAPGTAAARRGSCCVATAHGWELAGSR